MKMVKISGKKFQVDSKVDSVMSSWTENDLMYWMFPAFVAGDVDVVLSLRDRGDKDVCAPAKGDLRAFSYKRVQMSNKISLKYLGKSEYIPHVDVDVPFKWFSKGYLAALSRINFLWYKGNAWVQSEVGAADYLVKMYLLCQSTAKRSFFDAALETLSRYENYRIDFKMYKRCKDGDRFVHMPESHRFLIKEEHANKGFYAVSAQDSVFCSYKGPICIAMEEPKKALARVSRLVETPEFVGIGKHKCFVLADVPEELKSLFVTGSGYFPWTILGRLGAMRIVGPVGTKTTTMPYVYDMESNMDNMIVLSKASFKSGLNGILCANGHGLMPRQELLKTLVVEKRVINGVEVEGYVIDVQLNVSHFYCLHGLRSKPVGDDEDVVVSFDEMECSGSYFSYARNLIALDPGWDMLGDIQRKLDSGELYYERELLALKSQEFTVARFSYGAEVATKFIDKVVEKSSKFLRGDSREGLDMACGVDINAEAYDVETFRTKVCAAIWPRIPGSNRSVLINPGRFDPADFFSEDVANRAIDIILNGDGVYWSGLLSKPQKKYCINGYEFILPGGNTMKDYIYHEEGSNRIFFTGPAAEWLKLMISIRNRKTEWDVKYAQHCAMVQQQMFGENIDNFLVEGFHKVLLPGFWMDQDEVACIHKLPYLKNGKRVTFSKMPVLFNKAIADVKMNTKLPVEVFGDLDPRCQLALQNVLFCNVDLLMDHQNDTDGDIGRISSVGGILPIYDGLPKHMHQWAENYINDEMDLVLKYRAYKAYTTCEMTEQELSNVIRRPVDQVKHNAMVNHVHQAVVEATRAKSFMGIGTNTIFTISDVLQWNVNTDEVFNVVVRDAVTMQFQNDVVRGIKHETESNLKRTFYDLSVNTLFYGVESEFKSCQDVRDLLSEIVLSQTGYDFKKECEDWFRGIDFVFCNEGGNPSPVASRRVRDLSKLSYDIAPYEFDIAVLDLFTRSYLNSVVSAAPMPLSFLEALADTDYRGEMLYAHGQWVANKEQYFKKYILLGNMDVLGCIKVGPMLTMHHYLLSCWSHLAPQEYSGTFGDKPAIEGGGDTTSIGDSWSDFMGF